MKDVESMLEDVTEGIQAINMSVDPMTGRNPSYCFVDFKTKVMAERVMEEYNGREFMRRALRVKLGVKSGTGSGRFDMRSQERSDDKSDRPFSNERWKRLDDPPASQDDSDRKSVV